MKVGVIGYGSMGKMLSKKLSLNSNMIDGKIYVANRSYAKIADLTEKYIVCKNNQTLVKSVDVLFICVKPIDMKVVLEEIKDDLRSRVQITHFEISNRPRIFSHRL